MHKFKDYRGGLSDVFLTESNDGKNLHLEHIEDEVLNRGVIGTRDAINFLQSLRDMLAGHAQSKVNVTTKWDGCVHGDTIILTNLGDMTIRDIVNSQHWSKLKIMGRNFNGNIAHDTLTDLCGGISKFGDKSWIEITLENGKTIKLTEDHEVHTKNRGWIAAGSLIESDDITEL
jgi:hypothetical protein